MTKERKASVIYEGNASQLVYAFPFDYLRKKFVKIEDIYTNITELTMGVDYTVEDKQVRLVKGIPLGHSVKIYRETTTAPLVEWQDASVLRSADLSLQEVQLLHLAEETADKVFDSGMSTAYDNPNCWDGQYKRIINALDPIEDGDVVTLRYIKANQDSLLNKIKNTGETQNKRLTDTGNSQNKRLISTGDAQNKRLTDTGNSYVKTMTSLKDTAATKATEADNSAHAAMKWAIYDTSPDGYASSKSSKTWAGEAKNSANASASSANTSKTNATNASNSATTATQKATAAASSASAAATSASKAATSATNAKTSETNAASSASAAAKSAENAKTWDPTSYLGAKPYLKGVADGETPIQVTVPAERGIYPIFNGYPDSFPSGFNRHGLIVNFLGDSGTTLSLYALNENGTLLMRTGWDKSWRTHWYKLATQDTVDNAITTAQKDNTWLWNSLHRLGQNYKLPSTNAAINKLGVFSSYYNTANVIPNQPTRYGQLINIPADMQDEGTQLWLSQADGTMYHRGGNSSTPVTSTKFKRFLDSDDYNMLQNADKVVSVPVTNAKGTDHITDVVCLKSGHVVWVQFAVLKVEGGYAGSRANASITGLPKPLYRVWTLGDTMGLYKGMSHLRGFVDEDYFTWHYCPAWETADGDECVYNFTYLTND